MKSSSVKPWGSTTGGIQSSMPSSGMNARSSAYEGASQTYRLQQKGMGGGGPNGSINYALNTLRDRSRHAVRNNAYAAKATESYVSNMVGSGIKAKFENKELQKLWKEWCKNCDYDGNESFSGLQSLVTRGQFESGEVLSRMIVKRSYTNNQVPLQLQVIESDYLDESMNLEEKNKRIKMGIEFGAGGRRRFYHLWRNHPQDLGGYNSRIRVNAADVLHVYRVLRPGQLRGIPESSPVLVRLYEIDEMQDATLVRQKTAALFGWIIRKREAGEPYVPGVPVGSVTPTGQVAEASDDREMLTKITPGGIHYLEDDEDIEFSQPADIASIYAEYLKTELHAIAAGWGVTYEQLTGDLSGVNYSSIRAGLIEFRRRIEMLQETLLKHKFCIKVADRWVRLAVISGLAPAEVTLENYQEYLPEWQSPRWDAVDRLKDSQSDLFDVRAGFSTRAAKQLERGNDPDETDAQLALEHASGLQVDSDPSKLTKAGQDQDRGSIR